MEFVNIICAILVFSFINYFNKYLSLANDSKEVNNSEKALKHISFIFILLIISYFSIYYYSKFYNEYNKLMNTGEVFENNLIYILPLIITLILYFISIKHKNDPSKYLRSKKGATYSNLDGHSHVSTRSVKNNLITTYPRFTVYCRNSYQEFEIIFDSSDFEVINKSFGTTDGLQQSLKENKTFRLKQNKYKVEDIQVDFIRIFADYSYGRTDIYEGISTPYNIQVIINCINVEQST